MKPFEISADAIDEINAIWLYLTEQAGEEFAERTLRGFLRAFAELAERPGLGHRRTDLTTQAVYFHFVDPYFVVYQRDKCPLPIVGVVHSARDLRKMFRKRRF